jgi:hypothetical protein
MGYLLICEGPCNPQLPETDAILSSVRKLKGEPPYSVEGTRLMQMQRSLRHTEHTVSENIGECVICHTSRRYGGNDRRYTSRLGL